MKRIFSYLLVLCLCLDINAGIISSKQAEKLAQNFLNKNAATRASVADADLKLALEKKNLFYIFNNSDNGFIIVSANDATPPILGYTDNGSFSDIDSLPDGLKDLLACYESQLDVLMDGNYIGNNNVAKSAFYGTKVLETPTWGQRTPYNRQTPKQYPVGCVATAMAEIMRFHRWPEHGIGAYKLPVYYLSNVYVAADYMQINFGATRYDWDNMPMEHKSNFTQDEIEALSTLMLHAGMGVSMRYGASGSGALSSEVGYALTRYFNYVDPIEVSRDAYSSEDWGRLMRYEIDANRPVLYSSMSNAGEGHAYVLDGYQNDMFHFNWGWNGVFNGLFLLSNLVPDDVNYYIDQSAVIGILPNKSGKLSSPIHVSEQKLGCANINMDVRKVTANNIFHVYANCLDFQVQEYEMAVALMNKDYKIKEIVSQLVTVNKNSSFYVPFVCKSKTNASDGDMIGLVTINPSTQEFEYVCTDRYYSFHPYTISATDNEVDYVNVNLDILGPITAECKTDSVLRGSGNMLSVFFSLENQVERLLAYSDDKVTVSFAADHMANIFFDFLVSRDYSFLVADTGAVTIKLHAYTKPQGTCYVHCDQPGNLDGILKKLTLELEDKTRLVVTGSIDARDLFCLSKVSYIDTIDLYQANIEAYDRFPADAIPSKSFMRSNINTLFIPKTVSEIQNCAFIYSKIKNITIEKVAYIDALAFSDCTELLSLYIRNTEPPAIANNNVFSNLNKNLIVHIPVGCRLSYLNSSWKQVPSIKADIITLLPIASDPQIETSAGQTKIFNLSGQEIDNVTNSGIYIINGEKKYQEAY